MNKVFEILKEKLIKKSKSDLENCENIRKMLRKNYKDRLNQNLAKDEEEELIEELVKLKKQEE